MGKVCAFLPIQVPIASFCGSDDVVQLALIALKPALSENNLTATWILRIFGIDAWLFSHFHE
jgi:hypothetical protein